MRLNKYIALATGMSRRGADSEIEKGNVLVNGEAPEQGQQIDPVSDKVKLSERVLRLPEASQTIILNKPIGYVTSRDGQGSKTIYDLLPIEYHNLKPAGRLDKDSSGLLLLTNDGDLHHQMTHPSFQKEKIYEIKLSKPLGNADYDKVEQGIQLDDGLSKLSLNGGGREWQVRMGEGRNRQIRRTFEALGYKVIKLHRTHFGPYQLADLATGKFRTV